MTCDLPRRRNIRLKGYDYRQAGAYFVTICTQHRACLFGGVVDGEMVLNAAGRMVNHWWVELGHKFPAIRTDAYVVMPNHFHGIIIVGADLRVRPNSPGDCPNSPGDCQDAGGHTGPPLRAGATVPAVVQWFKTMTTNEYIRNVKTAGWPSFAGKLWQRNYFERIVRDAKSMNRIRQYIHDNPVQWISDNENPNHAGGRPGEHPCL